jgi:hypothetical protein
LPAASNAEKNRDARRKLLHDYMPDICGEIRFGIFDS